MSFFLHAPSDTVIADLKSRAAFINSSTATAATSGGGSTDTYKNTGVPTATVNDSDGDGGVPSVGLQGITLYKSRFDIADENGIIIFGDGNSSTATQLPNKDIADVLDAEIAISGDYGTLRRAKINFIVYTQTAFEDIDSKLGTPGTKIKVRYKYATTEGPGGMITGSSKWIDLVVYDFAYTFNTNGPTAFTVQITMKCVGAAQFLSELNVIGNIQAGFKGGAPREFVSSYEYFNDTTFVATIFDVFDYDIQELSGQLQEDGFEPPHGWWKENPAGGFMASWIAPSTYENPDDKMRAVGDDSRVNYCSLDYIFDKLINEELLENNKADMTDDIKAIKYKCDATTTFGGKFPWLYSTDPFSILITGGDEQMNYTLPSLPGRPGKSKNMNFNLGLAAGTMPKVIGTATNAELNNIMISRDFLRSIQGTIDADKFSIKDFLKKIFEKIKECSAGIINLQESADPKDPNVILIKNVSEPSGTSPADTYKFNVAIDWNVIDLSISSKIPSSMAAEAFAGGGTGTNTGDVQKTLADQRAAATTLTAKLKDDLTKIRTRTLPIGSFGSDAKTAAKAALKAMFIDGETPKEKTEKAMQVYPLSLSIELEGIEGFTFGDYITTTFLPKRYKPGNLNDLSVVFTVLDVTQRINVSTGKWSTALKTIARLVKF